MSAVKYLLILINLLFLSGIPVPIEKNENITLKNCTTEEYLAVQQKCDRLAKEVDGYLEDYDGEISTDEVMKNMTELYEKVTNCYSQFGCREAVEYNAKLEREALDMKVFNTGIKDCMLEFYGAIYEGTYNCTAGFDWFSKETTVKRDGFIKGRSCLMEIATNECSNKTLNYLNSEFNSFVDLMTVKPSGPSCEGLHYELNDLRCNQPIERAMMQGFRMISKLMPMEDEEKEGYKPIIDFFEKDTTNLTLICVVLKDCLDNSCSLPKGSGDFAGNLCNEAKKAENLNEAFFSCMKHLDDRINGTKYPCTQKFEFASFFSIEGQKDYFWKDKECTRSVMKGECPEGALVDFDAQWQWATNIAMKNEESKNNCLFHVASIQASDYILSNYVFSKDCVPKESVLSLGMCTRYINQLRLVIDETPSVNASIDKVDSVLNTCHSVVKCYNGSECAHVKKNAVTFQEKCLFLEFEYSGVTDCMSDFYKEVYEPNSKCTQDFDWFSKDMEVRKDAYTSGKSCFMSFLKNNCSAKTNEYIDSNYFIL